MNRSNGTLNCKNTQRVFYQYWLPDQKPLALVILVHGLAEHSGRYGHVAQYLVDAGLGVCGLDLPGHGQSSGTPGHVDSFEHYLEALRAVQDQCLVDYPDVPLILLGHSMGGLVAANYLPQYQQEFCAAVFSGAAVSVGKPLGAVMRGILKVLSASTPRVGVMKLSADAISRDPAVVQRYVSDPLVYNGRISACLVSEMFAAMSNAMAKASTLNLPMLMLHGGQDKLVAASGSRRYHELLASPDKALNIYPDLFHEIFNEPEQGHVLNQALTWILPRIPQ
jgi:alpha-beta hydrolase superfamily lysophospholipase